jgi:acetyltransferase-like isoleucine patch superfamily enzyme
MRLAFDSDFFAHVNASRIAEGEKPSKALRIFETALRIRFLAFLLWMAEGVAVFLLSLNIPIYRSLLSAYIGHMQGLPNFLGNYMRALYWRSRLGHMGRNVMIEQNVFFANPKMIRLSDFSFIDKNVMILAKSVSVGRRVHIAPNAFISGGGCFSIADHACIGAGVQVITATEVISHGNRCSGPMTRPDERSVFRSQVLIEEDAFIGAGAILLPGVLIKRGAVVGAGLVVQTDVEEWVMAFPSRPGAAAKRQPVRFPEI